MSSSVRMKDLFLLDPAIAFLNHGSFGATPKPVFDTYVEWTRKAEREPVAFYMTDKYDHLAAARAVLGDFVGAAADDLVYIENATTGVNIVAKSLSFAPDDEIVGTNHIYGACDKTFQFVCDKTGAKQVIVDIPMPCSDADMIERIWDVVTPKTKLIFLSHITSPTALILPVAEICRRARRAGILTLIDGAHVPGQLDLDVTALDCDFYTGNCHKWLNSPKSAAFLYVKPEHQERIEPLVTSWGWQGDVAGTGSPFLERLQLLGTRSQAAFLSVPRAIQFQQEHDWSKVQESCHKLVTRWLDGMQHLTGMPSLYAEAPQYRQLAAAQLPDSVTDVQAFKRRLYEQYHVQMPGIEWNGKNLLRVSVQGYNDVNDIDRALDAIAALLQNEAEL